VPCPRLYARDYTPATIRLSYKRVQVARTHKPTCTRPRDPPCVIGSPLAQIGIDKSTLVSHNLGCPLVIDDPSLGEDVDPVANLEHEVNALLDEQ
jgi:hypothetical protein